MDRNADIYVPDTRYKPTQEYFEHVLAKLPRTWRLKQDHFWTYALAPKVKMPVQGWKIHVSALHKSAHHTLDLAVPLCLSHDTEFKFASDPLILSRLLGKLIGRQSSGKFMTIYPRNVETCRVLLDKLYEALRDEQGPYILSDRQYKDSSVVFYRYGGFASFVDRSVDGSKTHNILNESFEFCEDQRRPRFVLPPFVEDIFAAEADSSQGDAPEVATRFDTHYEMKGSIKHSNAGGVYVAKDKSSEAKVLIKEARPHIGLDAGGSDAIARLEKEHRILTQLGATGIAPRAIDLFQEWRHTFLVQEFIEGVTLRQFMARNNRVIHSQSTRAELNEYVSNVTRIAIHLLEVFEVLHKHGIVFGDLSPNNVIINPETLQARLIDFEGAYEPGVDGPVNMFTPGFGTRARARREGVDFCDDYYALGCVLLCMLAPNVTLAQWNQGFVRSFFDEVCTEFDVPSSFVAAVETLLAAEDVDLAAVKALLGRVDGYHRAKRVELDIQTTLDGIFAHYHSMMNVEDPERLLPVTAMMDDCMAVDRGMLGIAYAWQKVRGEIPGKFSRWIEQRYRPGTLLPGLMNGLSGTSWVLHELGMFSKAQESLALAGGHRLLFEKMSFGVGAAGFGMSQLFFWQRTRDPKYLQEARRIADIVCDQAVDRGQGAAWDLSADGHVEVGLMEGATGIALFLLYAYCATKEPRYLETGERGLAHDLACGRQLFGSLGFPRSTGGGSILYPYLAQGSAGIGTVALRYYVVTKNEHYLRHLQELRAAVTLKYTISPDLFAGLAGLGNYLLDVHDLLGDDSCRALAHETARGLRLFEIPRPEGVAFPHFSSPYVNCDYASGSAGIATFLHRLASGGPNTNFMLDELLSA